MSLDRTVSEAQQRFGDLCQKARNKRGWTQEKVAAFFGRKQSFIGNIEQGKRRMSAMEFMTWVKRMALSPEEWTEFMKSGCLTQSEVEAVSTRSHRKKRKKRAA
jgi:transcriptional regulator with XRE-family HTH domain